MDACKFCGFEGDPQEVKRHLFDPHFCVAYLRARIDGLLEGTAPRRVALESDPPTGKGPARKPGERVTAGDADRPDDPALGVAREDEELPDPEWKREIRAPERQPLRGERARAAREAAEQAAREAAGEAPPG